MAYVDDTILIATRANFKDMHTILSDMMTLDGGAIEWSNDHNSKFELSKLALMDFAHRNSKKVRQAMTLLNTTIPPTTSAKYLGMYFDQHLDWKTQCNYALEKGMKWSAQIRHVAAPSWGLTPKHAHRLYISVTIPRILHAIDMWGSPLKDRATPSEAGKVTGQINKLASTQRAGALAITGRLRISPTDVLNVHAFTLPIHLEIEKYLYRSATHIATLLVQHPIHKLARRCASRHIKRHKSPLHNLIQAFNVKIGDYETILMTGGNPPSHKRPFKINIAPDKKASIKVDKEG
jgi:hypothetical protein